MARMPGATWQPLAANYAAQPRMSRYDITCIHTMVGGLIGTDSYFRTGNGLGYAGTESHFGTGGRGEIVQWQDTAYQADANYNGNHRVLSIENADMGPGFPTWNIKDSSAIPAFTPEQIEAIARICAWTNQAHGIPLELIPDSKPGRRGIGYHRLGVPGYMIAGGEQWSTSQGKVCPGNRRIAQVQQIIDRARVLAGQAPAAPPVAWNGQPPTRLTWNWPTGHCLGSVTNPSATVHGGINANEQAWVRNIQQWLIYQYCVPGVDRSQWATSGWADGKWETETDQAMAAWHAGHYPGQPAPTQCWSDDYTRLATP